MPGETYRQDVHLGRHAMPSVDDETADEVTIQAKIEGRQGLLNVAPIHCSSPPLTPNYQVYYAGSCSLVRKATLNLKPDMRHSFQYLAPMCQVPSHRQTLRSSQSIPISARSISRQHITVTGGPLDCRRHVHPGSKRGCK